MTIRRINVRLLRLSAGLAVLSVLVSGCFQTAGAALESTATPQGGAVVAVGPTQTQPPPPTAITPQITLTPTVAQLLFTTETATGAPPTETPFPSPVPLNVIPSSTATVINTNTPVPTSLVFAVSPTATLLPTETAFPTATRTPSNTPTEPILITPTKVNVAQANTPVFGNGAAATQTLQALNAQATGILQTVTAAAAVQQTLIATLAGTGVPNGAVPPTAPPAPGVITPLPTAGPASINGTPQGTPGSPGSGAAGFITGDCQYTVVSGDRLYRIALRFNITPYRISTANNLLNPELIVPGQILRIPGCNGTLTPVAAAANTGGAVLPQSGSAGRTYVVQEGDTLFAIAMRNGVRVMAIAQANGITNINLIYIGQTITIP